MIDQLVLLTAIAMIETGGDDLAIGKKGEVSRFQILPATWASYANKSHKPTRVEDSTRVALKQITFLDKYYRNVQASRRASLNASGDFDVHIPMEPSAYDLAVMWNYGAHRYASRKFNPSKIPKSVSNYACRVENIYDATISHPSR